MLHNRIPKILLAVAAFALLLSACGSPTPTITPRPAASATSAVAATTAPTVAPTTAVATTPAATIAATTAATVAPTVAATTPAATSTATAIAMATTPTTAVTIAATKAPTVAATQAATAAPAPAQETPPATKPAELPQCSTTGVLKVGTDASYPPFENVNEKTGKIEGFDIDLLEAIGKKIGFSIEPHNALFDTIFTALAYGQYDLVISASTITEERKKTVNFSNPYFVAGQVIVVRKADIGKIKTTADLAGKTIGVQLGTTGAEAARGIPNVKSVKDYPTAPEAFQALANGDVDAVVNDNVTSLSIILNSPKLNLAVVGQPFTQEFYGIAVRKECTDLLKKINQGLAEVIADGTYAEIYAKYLGEQPGPEFRKGGTGVILTPAATTAAGGGAPTQAATTAATPAATIPATMQATSAATSAATP
jgi:polar amino acid transport system substrate-binding protein